MHKAILKVKGGKLIKIFLDYKDDKITKINITGDFFMHPEEGIEMLEESLIGIELNQESLKKIINNTIKKNNIKMFGVDSGDIVECIFSCLNKNNNQ